MKPYTIGKKLSAIVIHQMFMIIMMTCLFASDYFLIHHMRSLASTFGLVAIISLAFSFIALAFITTVAGQYEEGDELVHYQPMDRIPSDIFLIVFILFIGLIIALSGNLKRSNIAFVDLMVIVGVLSYIVDTLFVIMYHSIIRRMKGGVLFTGSIIYKVYDFFRAIIKKESRHFCTSKTKERFELLECVEKIAEGKIETKVEIDRFHGNERELAIAINNISEGFNQVVVENTKNERMKADLITNVSHDIKTPLTSIINYVELLKREELDNEKADYYIKIIDEKSHRLKQLTEDLVEASKISSGNIKLDITRIDLVELLYQTGGEFNERFEQRNLTIVTKIPSKAIYIEADGRQLYRSIENLYTNAAKYAMENTRVYVDLQEIDGKAVFTIKNVSQTELKIRDGESNMLTERFVRGEESRTTEGSGLGLSIAKNLTLLMGGTFEIEVDGDLFIATITFKMA